MIVYTYMSSDVGISNLFMKFSFEIMANCLNVSFFRLLSLIILLTVPVDGMSSNALGITGAFKDGREKADIGDIEALAVPMVDKQPSSAVPTLLRTQLQGLDLLKMKQIQSNEEPFQRGETSVKRRPRRAGRVATPARCCG